MGLWGSTWEPGAGSWMPARCLGAAGTNTDRALLPACGSGREHQARAWFCPLRSSRDHVPDPSLSKGVSSPSWEVAPHAQDSGLVLSLEPGGPGRRDAGSSLRRFSGSLDNSPKTLVFPPPGMQTLVDG
uniref:Uncharacterized protein n=1 Tax=Myotis myotis TaxID=51298 RepID=A0A7J7S2D4_MYOMY|nr:hypothetical protein mMyoMyo1_010042 [Myotis myotis]